MHWLIDCFSWAGENIQGDQGGEQRRLIDWLIACLGENSQGDQGSDSGGSSKEFEIIDDKESSS